MANDPRCPLADSEPFKFDFLPIEFKERFVQRLAPRDAIKNFARTSKTNGILCAKYHIATLLEQEYRNRQMAVYQPPMLPRSTFYPWDFPRRGPGSGNGGHIPGAPRPWMI